MSAPREYRRLPGTGFTLISRCSLWLGKDHLLAAETTFYTETYRRFYFHDLQAVVIQEGRARRDWTLILGLITGLIGALFGLILLVSRADTAGWIIFAVLEVPLLTGLLVNGLRGPTCKCRLQTAVQAVELPSLRRLRKAERVIDTLRPLIEQAQGVVSADMLRSLRAPATAPARAPAPATAPPAGTDLAPEPVTDAAATDPVAVSPDANAPVASAPASEHAPEPASEPGPDLINNLLHK
jgi:hypothetical protein